MLRTRFREPSRSSIDKGCHKVTNSSCRSLTARTARSLIEETERSIREIDRVITAKEREDQRTEIVMISVHALCTVIVGTSSFFCQDFLTANGSAVADPTAKEDLLGELWRTGYE
jgi:hypothetical protein